MILDRTRRNLPMILAAALIVLLAFWSRMFQGMPVAADNMVSTGIFHHFLMLLTPTEALQGVASLLATLGLSVSFYFINNKHSFVQLREHLLVFMWIFQYAAFPQLHHSLDVHLSVFFILLSLNRLFCVYRKEYDFQNIFLTALYLALATLSYTLAAYLLIPILMGLLQLKPFKWRDMPVFMAGLFCPYYFAAFYFYFAVGIWSYPFYVFVQNIAVVFPIVLAPISAFSYLFLLYVAILLVAEMVISLQLHSGGVKQKMVVAISVFRFMLFVGVLVAVFYLPQNNSLLLFLAIPSTVVLTNFFGFLKKDLWANLLFAVFVLQAVLSAFTTDM